MLLEVKDLKVHYGKAEALKGISLSVESGTVVALLGANGAGKTTTLRTISGLKRLTSGEIYYQGQRIDELPAHEIVRRGIAHIPEGRMVFASFTVKENLEMGAYLIKDRKELARNLGRIFDHFPILKERQKQPAMSLSGGEQQMLATGRALMSNPKLVLMDEPSMGLSPKMVQEVGKIIRDINSEGVTIILVEQNARMALRLASYAYILEVGNIAMKGDGQKIANDAYVKNTYLGG
jgi:branched-chain amino acid transport system ATP-binding protein